MRPLHDKVGLLLQARLATTMRVVHSSPISFLKRAQSQVSGCSRRPRLSSSWQCHLPKGAFICRARWQILASQRYTLAVRGKRKQQFELKCCTDEQLDMRPTCGMMKDEEDDGEDSDVDGDDDAYMSDHFETSIQRFSQHLSLHISPCAESHL